MTPEAQVADLEFRLREVVRERDEAYADRSRARAERDEARAEVERLRERLEWQVECTKGLTAALRTVAERQREACVSSLRNRLKEANEDRLSVDYVRGLRAAIVYADAAPLATEGGK